MNRLLFRACGSTLVLVYLLLPARAAAQAGGAEYNPSRSPVQVSRSGERTFSVSGTVLDDSNNRPIDNARVGISGFAGGFIMESYVNMSGSFSFGGLARGTYYVTASHPDYEEKQEQVQVVSGPVLGITIFLRPRARNQAPPPAVEPLDINQELIPKVARKEFEKGVEEYNRNNLAPALVHFRKATELYPNYVSAIHAQGLVHMRQREYSDAQGLFEKAVGLNPNVAAPRIFLGALYNAAQRFAEAEEHLAYATKLNSKSGLAFFELSRAYWGLQNLEKAEEAVARAHELSPKIPQVHLIRANVLLARGNYEGVLAEFDEFLALVPTGPIADHVRQRRTALQEQLAKAVRP
ncbi:MAG TPA: tetratricopeptide repeat protein [Candidatus Xenobia bacterium]|nr:tetratricopeptide repeat protein [Candidatus Xenobia bacterium]